MYAPRSPVKTRDAHDETFTGAGEGDARLAVSVLSANATAEYGRLEVFHSGGWGTVCDTDFTDRGQDRPAFGGADVVCRQLGYQHGFQIQKLVSPFALLCATSVQAGNTLKASLQQTLHVKQAVWYIGMCGTVATPCAWQVEQCVVDMYVQSRGRPSSDLNMVCSAVSIRQTRRLCLH